MFSTYKSQGFLHDGNPLDGENQVRNTVGILNKIGAWLLSFWIIILELMQLRSPDAINVPV